MFGSTLKFAFVLGYKVNHKFDAWFDELIKTFSRLVKLQYFSNFGLKIILTFTYTGL